MEFLTEQLASAMGIGGAASGRRAERASTLGRHTEHPLDAEASRPGAAGAGRAARTAHSHRRLLRVRAGSLPPGRLAALIRPRLPAPSGLARDSPASAGCAAARAGTR